uniref:DNA-directed DNA polymerase n=1 Tax=Steinernema glaseri TaxID=37863 RepID=A0A1I8A5C2_9BILA
MILFFGAQSMPLELLSCHDGCGSSRKVQNVIAHFEEPEFESPSGHVMLLDLCSFYSLPAYSWEPSKFYALQKYGNLPHITNLPTDQNTY